MRKFLSVAIAILIAITTFSVVGCSSKQYRDETKIQLDISYFAGGFGDEWIYKAKEEFELAFKDVQFEDGKTGVEIWIDSNKTMLSDIQANLKAGTNLKTLYLTSDGNMQTIISSDLAEDITDIYSAKPDGESGRTIAEKTLGLQNILSAYGNGVDKYYALPYTQAIIGFVFDYDLFVQKEWLAFADESDLDALEEQGFTVEESTVNGTDVLKLVSYSGTESYVTYEVGEVILKAGKDGKFGTYDDGQPQDIDEWDAMVGYICADSGSKPFIYAYGQPDYMDGIVEGVFAQYDGISNYEITYDYDGTYVKPSDGTEVPVTIQNGYETFRFEGRKVALEFMENYLDNDSYVHPSSEKLGRTAIDIQKDYVLGYKGVEGNPLSGMIIEGIWWENESKSLMNSLVNEGHGYGARDYRYMLYPAFEGQKGIDGNGNGSVFASHEDGAMFISKQAKQAEKDAAKEFIKFISSDYWLAKFTAMTGGVRPYDYTLSNDQFNGLTDFQKCVWNIYHDSDNYAVVSPKLMHTTQKINYDSAFTVGRWTSKVDQTRDKPIVGLLAKNVTAQKYFDGMAEYYSPSQWKKLVDTIM